jgi:serine/threonine protein kinase/formylglycine-generating enzyme required for sulfatase activity
MFCPKCGGKNGETSRFCKKCGATIPARAAIRKIPSTKASRLGQIIEAKYLIEAELGSGGMGEVYKATRMLIGDSVAIKILHSRLADDPQAKERFRREAITATRLRHGNIVALFDVGVIADESLPYLLMELAAGSSLRQIIAENRILPLDFVVAVAAQVCAALGEAHQLGVVHRDIKPENIVVNRTDTGWQIKILDFGIAKLYDQIDVGFTQDGTALGTPRYMSPEQCLGEQLDGRSDLYSLAIVLYEMLCGTVPFKSSTPAAIALSQVQSPPPRPSSLNPGLDPAIEDVVLRCLSKLPNRRPPTAAAFAQEFVNAATNSFKRDVPTLIDVSAYPPKSTPASDDLSPVPHVGHQSEPLRCDDDRQPGRMPQIPLGSKQFDSPDPDPAAANSATSQNGSADGGDVRSRQGRPNGQVSISSDLPGDLDGYDPDKDSSFAAFDDDPAVVAPGVEIAPDVRRAVVTLDDTVPKPSSEISSFESPHGSFAIEDRESDPKPESDPAAITALLVGSLEVSGPASPKPERERAVVPGWVLVSGVLAVLIIGAAGGIWLLREADTNTSTNANGEPTAPLPAQPAPPAGMAFIPGGEFMMGDDRGDEFSRPPHKVTVEPFFMDITEVTNEEYKKFIDAVNFRPPPDWNDAHYPVGNTARFPVTGVAWNDAAAYAKWAGKRLPTEEEWEYAARGGDGRVYPWGDEWDPTLANAGGTSRGLREVGKGGKSPFGMFDMSGNAWEWTSTDEKAYPGGRPFDRSSRKRKVIRGGGWQSSRSQATAVNRAVWGVEGEPEGYSSSGFRCVKDPATP